MINDLQYASKQDDSNFLFLPNNYAFGKSTEDITINIGGLDRDFKAIRPDQNTQKNWQPNEVKTSFNVTIKIIDDLINSYILYSLEYSYVDGSFAFAISTKEYADIEVIISLFGKQLSETNKNQFVTFLNDFYDQINGSDCDAIDVYYEGLPSFIAKYKTEEELKKDLKTLSKCLVDEIGTNEEKAIINIINTYGHKNPDELFGALLSSVEGNETIFSTIYDSLDDIGGHHNFSTYIVLLYKYWLQSSYNKATVNDALPYSTEKAFGFYFDNYDVISENGYIDNFLVDENDEKLDNSYHIYDPILLCTIGQSDNGLKIPSTTIPFFLLKAYDDKNHNLNVFSGGKLTFDVVTTFSGVGNLSKLRHLRHLSKLQRLKVIVGSIEVTSGIANMLLSYTDNCGNSEFCEKLSTYLFWVEIGSLSMDAFTESMIKKAAREALGVTSSSIPSKIQNHLEEVAMVTKSTGWWSKFDKINNLDATVLAKLDDWIIFFGKTEAENIASKLNKALSKYPKLADELQTNCKLIDHFGKMQTTWYYRIGLARTFKNKGGIDLPENFGNVLKDLDMYNGISIRSAFETKDLGILGRAFEDEMSKVLSKAWASGLEGIKKSKIPNDLIDYYSNIYRQGYTKMLEQIKISTPNGSQPVPDFLFFKSKGRGGLDLNDVIYHDAKIGIDSPWSSAQNDIRKIIQNARINNTKAEFKISNIDETDKAFLLGLRENMKITIKEMSKIGTSFQNDKVYLLKKSIK